MQDVSGGSWERALIGPKPRPPWGREKGSKRAMPKKVFHGLRCGSHWVCTSNQEEPCTGIWRKSGLGQWIERSRADGRGLGQRCLGDFQNESQESEVCSSFPFLSEVEGMRQAERTKWRGKYASKHNSGQTHAKCLYTALDVSIGAQVFDLLLSEVCWYCRPVQQKRVNDLRPEHVASPSLGFTVTLSWCFELLTEWFHR